MIPRAVYSVLLASAPLLAAPGLAASEFSTIPTEEKEGDRMLNEYFERETRRLTGRNVTFLKNVEDWTKTQADLRRQLFEMLGLQPLPARSPLKPEITGTVERDGVIVENLVFQSRPGLYVTANFYRPATQDGPLPTILYVCGHGGAKKDGVIFGNKTTYQHHGTWFARNGYTCLILDTLQLGEIEGTHHGTHHLGRWWWNARGYTPAGVEAWNGIRALDYLETRPEVDKTRFGVTGRSGGGASTVWIAALDERIQAAAPAAGITSMKNHVVDGCVEGHCDCMFMVNTYRWDFPLLTALIAPRPLLIVNTDKDRIFPLDGVVDVYTKTRQVYEAMGAGNHIGVAIYEGGHLDTQPLRVSAFHWFERHLKGTAIAAELPEAEAPKRFEQAELKVLAEVPGNERNTFIDDYFTKLALADGAPALPESAEDWKAQKDLVLSRLRSRVFRGWPASPEPLEYLEEFRGEQDGITFTRGNFQSQAGVRLPLFIARPSATRVEDLELIVLNALDEEGWASLLTLYGQVFPAAFPGEVPPEQDLAAFDAEKRMHAGRKWGMAYLPPRGIGPTAWTNDEKEHTHIRRRFALLGQTLDGMRIWDLRRGVQALRSIDGAGEPQLWLSASGEMAGNTLYTALFEEGIHRLDLHEPPSSHREGTELLNVLRFTDLPQVAAIAGETCQLRITTADQSKWAYLTQLAAKLAWPEKQIDFRQPGGED